MKNKGKKYKIIIAALICILFIVIVFFFIKDYKMFKKSEKQRLINALKKDDNYIDYNYNNDFYYIMEGNYDMLKDLDDNINLSYKRIDANDIIYEDYNKSPGSTLVYVTYSVMDNISTYLLRNLNDNVVYKVSYYYSSDKYTCFKNDHNVITNDCSGDFEILINRARDVKKDFSKELSRFGISLKKLINEYEY